MEPTVPTATTATTNGTGKGKKSQRPRAVKTQLQNAHFAIVLEAARTVTGIFNAHGLSCAVFGSLASKLYGCARCPKDVDLLVSQDPVYDTSSDSESSDSTSGKRATLDAGQLKDLVLRSNSRNFYLKMPRDPSAEYRILWYRTRYQGPECKVDILIPGTMHLPHLRPERVLVIDTIPVVPFSLLLYHKLQGWDDHCQAEEPYKKQKQHQDAGDIRRLMALKHLIEGLRQTKSQDEELFSEEFWALTVERVKRYCEIFQDRVEDWKLLGFETS
ncbi:hypothetical protein GALMADRAFT_235214 [Galerina marginata CBS 339.88]|uniref:Uncharacterized protein n=1 Tax=Galerina marginata (strain CBS 339.88) TaxID=685588 RepID=A0A067U3M3_GALM3|nr:hypothetical protein GALMADRAFT_235214 [Galerina marginata CBS 339.88]